jgi:colanic acid biosynthesis glycosyl transferase WcaI
MRLLFFSMWYSPEPVAKPHAFAKELVRQGNSVTVITGYPNYPKGKIYHEYKKKKLISFEKKDGVEVIRIPFSLDRSSNALKRILSLLSFSINSFLVAFFLFRRFDAIWTYQIGYPGFLYSVLTGTPHFHDIQDLWPMWSTGVMRGSNGFLTSVLVYSQKKIYQQSKRLITISDGFSKIISSQFGIKPSKINVLPNWADEEAFYRNSDKLELRRDFKLPDGFLVTYGGNVGTAQGLDALIKAAALLGNIPGLNIAIAGDGIEKEKLISMAMELSLKNIYFLHQMPQKKMRELLSLSDVLYLSLDKNPKYEITIPSKTYSYLSVGKPILAAAKGDVASLIKENDIGLTCEPGNPECIASMIKDVYMLSKNRIEEMGQKAYRLSCEKYSGNAIVGCYLELFKKM